MIEYLSKGAEHWPEVLLLGALWWLAKSKLGEILTNVRHVPMLRKELEDHTKEDERRFELQGKDIGYIRQHMEDILGWTPRPGSISGHGGNKR